MLYTGLLHESRSCAECGTHLCWANRHAYTNADRHTNSDPIGHAKRNAHSYGYSHNYTYNYAYSCTYRYRNSNSNSYAHFNTKGPSARSSDATPAPQSVTVYLVGATPRRAERDVVAAALCRGVAGTWAAPKFLLKVERVVLNALAKSPAALPLDICAFGIVCHRPVAAGAIHLDCARR